MTLFQTEKDDADKLRQEKLRVNHFPSAEGGEEKKA
jgi:hypothetical protein